MSFLPTPLCDPRFDPIGRVFLFSSTQCQRQPVIGPPFWGTSRLFRIKPANSLIFAQAEKATGANPTLFLYRCLVWGRGPRCSEDQTRAESWSVACACAFPVLPAHIMTKVLTSMFRSLAGFWLDGSHMIRILLSILPQDDGSQSKMCLSIKVAENTRLTRGGSSAQRSWSNLREAHPLTCSTDKVSERWVISSPVSLSEKSDQCNQHPPLPAFQPCAKSQLSKEQWLAADLASTRLNGSIARRRMNRVPRADENRSL